MLNLTMINDENLILDVYKRQIIDRFYYLKLEEIKLCFRNAMASGKIYDRLDGNIILGWLNEYDAPVSYTHLDVYKRQIYTKQT